MTLAETIREQQHNITSASSQLDNAADDMARALAGRLHHVRGYQLQVLKRALRDFDARNCEWRR